MQINIRDGMLTIEGKREEHTESDQRSEFFYGRFMRTLTLPSGSDEKNIKASYRDGILEVSIPMREPSEKAHSIPVSRSN
ncbi:MAG: Hsp20/alpha crystallin family protein [Candidatus Nanopelagicales bacterium]